MEKLLHKSVTILRKHFVKQWKRFKKSRMKLNVCKEESKVDLSHSLSTILGLLEIRGIGHICIGKVGKGIWILIGSLILFIIGIATVILRFNV